MPSRDDLRDASMLPLDIVAVTAEALAFTRELAASIAGRGTRTSARRSPAAAAAFEAAVGTIVGGLLRAWQDGLADPAGSRPGLCYRPMQAAHFTGEPVAFRTFRDALASLTAAGYVAGVRGHSSFLADKASELSGVAQRFAGRLWPTAQILTRLDGAGLGLADIERHFAPAASGAPTLRHPVLLFGLSERGRGTKAKGRPLVLPNTPEVARVRGEVEAMNTFAAAHEVVTTVPCGPLRWQRSFTLDLRLHGRWYAVGESYQGFPGARRAGMVTINGEPCAEIDLSGSHLTCILGYLGMPFDPERDPYAIEGVEDRRVVKAWITASVGKGEALRGSRWPDTAVARAREKEGLDLARYRLPEVSLAVLQRYPVLGRLPEHFGFLGSRYGCDPRRVLSLFVMGLEAAVLTDAMLALREQGVLALPVHDSLLVPRSGVGSAADALAAAFAGRASRMTPRLKVSVGQTRDVG